MMPFPDLNAIASNMLIFINVMFFVLMFAAIGISLYLGRNTAFVQGLLRPFRSLLARDSSAAPSSSAVRHVEAQRNEIRRTAKEVKRQLKVSRLTPTRKSAIQEQVDTLLVHVDETVKALTRVRQLQANEGMEGNSELNSLAFSLDTRLEDIHARLRQLAVRIVDVDTTVDERMYQRLIGDLSETNTSLSDLNASHATINRIASH